MLKFRSNPHLSRRFKLVMLSAAALMIGAVAVIVGLNHDAPNGGGGDTTRVVTYSQPVPSEVKVDDSYRVAATQPLSIEIASQNIKGYIQKVDTDQNKAIAAPNNVHLGGWFVDSVLPGKKGLSIIDGHVDGASQRGIFHDLSKVGSGDEVVVTMGDGTEHSYIVFAVKTVPETEARNYLFDQSPKITSQLNLITCTGIYQRNVGTYDKRVIVSAKLK